MRVKLTVAKGSNSGKAFEVNVPQFVIGRAKGCQLRPQSDAISRQHCVICVTEESATIRDLGSRNGTVVNGEKIEGTFTLSDGDELRVGPLKLTVSIQTATEAPSKPSDSETIALSADETRTIKPAKTAESMPTQAMPVVKASGPERMEDSGDISDWLAEDAEESSKVTKAETRRFTLDISEQTEIKKAADEVEDAKEAKSKKKKKKEPGKLPVSKQDVTADSKEAAEQTLKKMFQRGL